MKKVMTILNCYDNTKSKMPQIQRGKRSLSGKYSENCKRESAKAPVHESDDDSVTEIKDISSKEMFRLDDSSSSDDSDSYEDSLNEPAEKIIAKEEAPKVTRYIDLDTPEFYVADDSESEEERESNEKLQALIDNQTIARSKTAVKKLQHVNVCNLCYMPGHRRQRCNTCLSCGLSGHYIDTCNSSINCTRCKRRGHTQIECKFPEVNQPCSHCKSSTHISTQCPTLAHVYIGEVEGRKKTTPYCYYCGDIGHYGDECGMRHNLDNITPSAFSKYSIMPGGRYSQSNIAKHSASSFTPYKQGDHIRFSSPSPSENQRNRNGGNRGNNSRGGSHSRNIGRNNSVSSGELDNFFGSDRRRRPNPSPPQYQKPYQHQHQHQNQHQNQNQNQNQYKSQHQRNINNNNANKNNSNNNNNNKNNNNNVGKKQKRLFHDEPLSLQSKKPKQNNHQRFDGGNIHEFSHQRPVEDTYHVRSHQSPTGNNNWKALGGESMPKPTRSGTMNVGGQVSGGFVDYQADFPRNQRHIEILPRPSSSGVIDMPESSRARRPQYHGGYSKQK
ncbi:hypothetical protein J3Q64DRAFT_1726278 [Phycomyces blakesleeanus]|uniref:CCHC-type domain-containing protein n=1 Tax=Phycomyces blakesleeanus TaxID=4837 RepID=A0ABR3B883_PHYBL